MFEPYLDQQKIASMLLPRTKRLQGLPRCGDRAAWDALSAEDKSTLLEHGNKALDEEYPMLYLSRFRRVLKGEPYQIYDLDLFKRMSIVIDLALAECVANDGRYMEKLIDGLWLICEESTWVVPSHYNGLHPMPTVPDVDNPWVDIHASRRASSLATVAYLMEDKLNAVSPVIMQRIRRELDTRIVQPYLHREDFWWIGVHATMMNNWCTWCSADILRVMMLLYDDPYTVALGAYRVMWTLNKYLASVSPDGGCDEGVTYWSMASGKLMEGLVMLHQATDGGIDIFDQPLIRKLGEYPYKMHIRDDLYVNFADAMPHRPPHSAIMNMFGRMTQSEALQRYAAYLKDNEKLQVTDMEIYRELLKLFVPYSEDASCEHAEGERQQLENLQIYTWRQNGWFAAIKGGTNDESHNHNDLGHFILYRHGRPQIVDPGIATYTSKTFSPLRYTIWNVRANAHNIPLINGCEQHDGRKYVASVLEKDDHSVTYQLAKAYPVEAGVESYTRRFAIHGETITLRDEVQLQQDAPVCWIFMLANEPRWDAEHARLICPDFTMQCPENLTCEIEHMPIDDEITREMYQELWRVHLTAAPAQQRTAVFTIE